MCSQRREKAGRGAAQPDWRHSGLGVLLLPILPVLLLLLQRKYFPGCTVVRSNGVQETLSCGQSSHHLVLLLRPRTWVGDGDSLCCTPPILSGATTSVHNRCLHFDSLSRPWLAPENMFPSTQSASTFSLFPTGCRTGGNALQQPRGLSALACMTVRLERWSGRRSAGGGESGWWWLKRVTVAGSNCSNCRRTGPRGRSSPDLGWPARPLCPPELKVRTPAHTKHLGWYLEFEFRVTHRTAGRASSATHTQPRDCVSSGCGARCTGTPCLRTHRGPSQPTDQLQHCRLALVAPDSLDCEGSLAVAVPGV